MVIVIISLASFAAGYLMCYVAHIEKIKAGSIVSNRKMPR